MAMINKLLRIVSSGSDKGFESYYTKLARNSQGGPNAAEARRDYEAVRRVRDHMAFF